MHSGDRDDLKAALVSALGMYDRDANDQAVDTWYSALKAFDLARIRTAIRDHMDHPEDGKRAPRPVDIWRRLSHGGGKGSRCSATSLVHGRCEYPGVFSDSTDGSGQWWCPWHRDHRTGPQSEQAIEQSLTIEFADAARSRIERANAEAAQSPAVRRIREAMALRMRAPAKVVDPSTRQPGDDEEAAA